MLAAGDLGKLNDCMEQMLTTLMVVLRESGFSDAILCVCLAQALALHIPLGAFLD